MAIDVFSGTFASPGVSHWCYFTDTAVNGTCVSGTLTGVLLVPPTITSMSPSFGSNLGGTAAVITGTDFTGATSVTIGSAAASFTVVNATTINVTTPPGTIGAANVVVTTPQGSATAPGLFSFIGPPTITSVSPGSGPTSGGTSITITGANFTGATGVSFGGASATSFTVVNASTITAIAPPTAAGVVLLVVTVGTRTASTPFSYNPSASISVSPASVAEDGAPNLVYTVTLNQANHSAATSVNFTIGGTATNGTDYATITSPLVIPAGNTTGTITVNPTADATIESDETVTLTLAAGTGYTVGAPNTATGTILNDDLPNLVINDVTANEGNAGITNFTFTVSLSAPAGPGGVSFDIATANGTATAGVDYVASSLTSQTIRPAAAPTPSPRWSTVTR